MIGPTAREVEARGFPVPPWASTLGWQGGVVDLLNAADVLAISSRAEGHSNVAGEALLLGVPVATTDCGGHCEAVRRSGGRVVGVGDADALANAIAELLDDPPDPDAVRAAARDELSVDHMVAAHARIYAELLGDPELAAIGA